MLKTQDVRPAGRGPFAVKLADLKNTDKVLNIGCFDGSLERHFISKVTEDFWGVDLNETALNQARLLHRDRFQYAPAEKLPFANNVFDKVFLLDTLEHVENEHQTLDEVYRVLKPGGRLVLSVPHDFLNFLDPDELTRGARNLFRKYIRKKELLNHPKHRHYSESKLQELLSKFEIEKTHKCGTPVFWTFAMAYTAFGIPEKITTPLRKLTAPIEDLDYALSLPTGFNIMVRAVKKGITF